MYDTQGKAIDTRNNEPPIPLFHESHGSSATVDDARVGVHDPAGGAFESGRTVAFEQTATSGDHTDPF